MSKVIAHPNIALIKYWGKIDQKEITPLHGSLSVTLDYGCTTTTAKYSSTNSFKLNGEHSEISSRLQSAIDFFGKYNQKPLEIESENSFPTAAGFASSASGAAAFVGSLASLIGETDQPIQYWNERNIDLSVLARKVSGSGCRSIYGGFVEWRPGDATTSNTVQLYDENFWNDFVSVSITLRAQKKKVSSTAGMQQTVQTVPWMQWRAKEVVPTRISKSKEFIQAHDFNSLAEIIMKDSNELHANCAATFPPIRYMNDLSYAIVDVIHEINSSHNANIAAYSFDAGPNPHIFTTKNNLELILQTLNGLDYVEKESVIVSKPASGIQATLL